MEGQAASCMSYLADLYREDHKDAQAEPLYNGALKIWAKTAQSDSPEAISALASLGDIYHSQVSQGRAGGNLSTFRPLQFGKSRDNWKARMQRTHSLN